MNPNKKKEIEQLLSCYIDGQLSPRQETEVLRLIKHDDSIAEQLEQLKKQKQLLNCLPTATAPANLFNDIKASMERQLILEESSTLKDETAGAAGLFYRRIVSAAAALAIIGVLGWVVFDIIAPAQTPGTTPIIAITPDTTNGITPIAPEIFDPTPAAKIVCTANLNLTTDQPMKVNSSIDKAIYSNGLFEKMVPTRDSGLATYRITAGQKSIAALLTSLSQIWDQCETTNLDLSGKDSEQIIAIEKVTAAQTIKLFNETRLNDRIAIAENIAENNRLGIDDTNSSTPPTLTPIKPTLAESQPPKQIEKEEDNTQITLTITVKSASIE